MAEIKDAVNNEMKTRIEAATVTFKDIVQSPSAIIMEGKIAGLSRQGKVKSDEEMTNLSPDPNPDPNPEPNPNPDPNPNPNPNPNPDQVRLANLAGLRKPEILVWPGGIRVVYSEERTSPYIPLQPWHPLEKPLQPLPAPSSPLHRPDPAATPYAL